MINTLQNDSKIYVCRMENTNKNRERSVFWVAYYLQRQSGVHGFFNITLVGASEDSEKAIFAPVRVERVDR